MAGWPRAGKKRNHRAKAAAYSRGDVMTGAGRVPVIRVDDLGHVLSGAGFTIASAASQSLPNSYCIHIGRHTLHTAPIFTIGIRGATPPPAG
jgi:hypothetical protein